MIFLACMAYHWFVVKFQLSLQLILMTDMYGYAFICIRWSFIDPSFECISNPVCVLDLDNIFFWSAILCFVRSGRITVTPYLWFLSLIYSFSKWWNSVFFSFGNQYNWKMHVSRFDFEVQTCRDPPYSQHFNSVWSLKNKLNDFKYNRLTYIYGDKIHCKF